MGHMAINVVIHKNDKNGTRLEHSYLIQKQRWITLKPDFYPSRFPCLFYLFSNCEGDTLVIKKTYLISEFSSPATFITKDRLCFSLRTSTFSFDFVSVRLLSHRISQMTVYFYQMDAANQIGNCLSSYYLVSGQLLLGGPCSVFWSQDH